MKWEYLVYPMGQTEPKMDKLDCMGREGWELVSMYEGHAYFKRPLAAEEKWCDDRFRDKPCRFKKGHEGQHEHVDVENRTYIAWD